MKNEKKKGGLRKGAGRKPSGIQKEAVTIYTDVSRFGGKEGARIAIYEFLDGQINLTGKKSFLPLSDSMLATLHNAENKAQFAKTNLLSKKRVEELHGAHKDNEDIETQIDEIKKEKIPKERDTVYGRKSWHMEQQIRIQELKNQLKK